jgi:CheY-like chemotaxis protein
MMMRTPETCYVWCWSRKGARVTVVESAARALHALEDEHYDVLVADVAMPDQDGYSLIRAVRESSGAHAQIRSIAVTAYASTGDRELALNAGYNCHVAKPLDRDHLIATVAAAVHAA